MFKLYSQPNCPNCDDLKSYLKDREIKFEELNVVEDHAAKAFMIMNDVETTPAVYVNGNLYAGEINEIKHNIESISV